MRRGNLAAVGVLATVALGALLASPDATCSGGGLVEAAEGSGVATGVALSWHGLTEDKDYASILIKDASLVTLENASKWSTIHHQAGGAPDYQRMDALVDFAEDHDLAVKGHPLVWDEHVPAWLPPDLDPARFQALHDAYVAGVVGRYAGRIAAWDVVNEWIEDDGQPSGAPWFSRLGTDFGPRVSRRVQALDPKAKLFYNDYAIEWDNQRQRGVLDLLQGWRAAGVPLDGVGIQGHMVAGLSPSRAQWRQAIQRFAALGLEVHLSELDVRASHLLGAEFGRELARAQAFYDAVSACVDEPACTTVIFWGLTDRHSFMNRHDPQAEAPTLRDRQGQPRASWYAVAAALRRQPWPACAASVLPALAQPTTAPVDLSAVLAEGLDWRISATPAQAGPAELLLRIARPGRSPRFASLGQSTGPGPILADLRLERLPTRLDAGETELGLVARSPGGDPLALAAVDLRPRCDGGG